MVFNPKRQDTKKTREATCDRKSIAGFHFAGRGSAGRIWVNPVTATFVGTTVRSQANLLRQTSLYREMHASRATVPRLRSLIEKGDGKSYNSPFIAERSIEQYLPSCNPCSRGRGCMPGTRLGRGTPPLAPEPCSSRLCRRIMR